MDPNQTKKETKDEPKQLNGPKATKEDNLYLSNAAWIVVLCIILLIAIASYFVKPSSIVSGWNSFASVFMSRGNQEAIDVTLSSTSVGSDQPLILSYEHVNQKADSSGTYYLSYSCTEGLKLSVLGTTKKEVTCGRPFELTGYSSSSLNIIPTAKNNTSTTIEISYAENATSTTLLQGRVIKGEALLSVTKELTGTAPVSGAKNTATTTLPASKAGTTVVREPGPKTERYYAIQSQDLSTLPTPNPVIRTGPIDLAVTIMAVGKIEPVTNRFIQTKDLKSSDRIAVQFKIANVGTAPVSNWDFAASLPIVPPYTFLSDKQQELTPGDYVIYTIGFDHIAGAQGNIFIVTADPDNSLPELTKNNNVAVGRIDGVSF